MNDPREIKTESPTPTVIPLEVRCRDCFHFERERAPRFDDICSRMGILDKGRPCTSFLPDAHIINMESAEGKAAHSLISELSTRRLALFAALLQQEKRTRSYGFVHGDEIYVKVFPGDYLSNYARGWVIMINRKRVFVQGSKPNFRGVFVLDSIIDRAKFTEIRKDLLKRKRLVDPQLSKYTSWRPKKVTVDYEPPVVDGMLQERVNKKSAKKSGGDTVLNMRG